MGDRVQGAGSGAAITTPSLEGGREVRENRIKKTPSIPGEWHNGKIVGNDGLTS